MESTITVFSEDQKFWLQLVDKASKFEIDASFEAYKAKPKDDLVPVLLPDMNEGQVALCLSKIPEVEQEIKNLKKKGAAAKESRLVITRCFTDTSKRLAAAAENKYEEYEADLTKKLLPLKLAEAEIKRKREQREYELTSFKQLCLSEFNSQSSIVKQKIQDTISNMYSDCLEDEEEFDIKERVEMYADTFCLQDFELPGNLTSSFEDKEKDDIRQRIADEWKPRYYYDLFCSELEKAFSNFDVEKADKITAAENRKAAEIAAKTEIVHEEVIDNSFAQTARHYSSEPIFTEKTNKLKMIWVIEPGQSIFEIVKAFIPAIPYASEVYKGNNFNDVVEKIVTCLEALKNNGYQFNDLKFKQVSDMELKLSKK